MALADAMLRKYALILEDRKFLLPDSTQNLI